MKKYDAHGPEGLSSLTAFLIIAEAALLVGILEMNRRRSLLRYSARSGRPDVRRTLLSQPPGGGCSAARDAHARRHAVERFLERASIDLHVDEVEVVFPIRPVVASWGIFHL